jgi:hypothetical protein
LWRRCERGVRDAIFVAEDCGIIPLLWNFVRRVPLCEAGDMILNLHIQALTKLEDNVCALKVVGLVNDLPETIDILIDGS